MNISVVIPYFQREPNILKRALTSVLRQRLSEDVSVQIVVVDDGSPWPAQAEADGLSFTPQFHLTILTQENAGAGAARNTALNAIGPNSTYVAFLDSDDAWNEDHLEQGVRALQAGYDFYFCDNQRVDYHSSHFAACYPQILNFADAPFQNCCAEIPIDALVDALPKCFPTQASTIIFRRDILADLRFDHSLRSAGEDVLFFTQLVAKARRACFSTRVMVECGKGVNIYFSNFHWDSPARLAIIQDHIVALSLIIQRVRLAPDTRKWLENQIASYKRDFVFHSLRHFAKRRTIPPELFRMASGRMWYPLWFSLTAAQIAISMPLGLYRPR